MFKFSMVERDDNQKLANSQEFEVWLRVYISVIQSGGHTHEACEKAQQAVESFQKSLNTK